MSYFPTMQEVRVRSLTWAADGVLQVDLVHPAGAVLPAFEAAAHLDLLLPNGISRSYSLCNAPAEQPQRYQLGVGQEPVGAGRAMCMSSCARARCCKFQRR